MNNEIGKTRRGRGYGFLDTDADAIRRFMKDLGWTEARLAKEANLSQQQINRFLNGKRKLSAAASDRVFDAIQRGRQTMEAWSGRLGGSAHAEEALHDPDLEDPTAPPSADNPVVRGDLLEALSPPPRDRASYEAWKAKRVKQYESAKELPIAKAWIAHQDKRVADLQKQVSMLEEIKASNQEVVSLYQGLVARLKAQLRDAGLTPID